MPAGPVHLGFTLPVFSRFKTRFDLLPLAIGSFVPDIELLLMWPVAGGLKEARGVMHSFVGALTIDVVFALIYAYFVAVPLMVWVKAKWPDDKLHLYDGRDASERFKLGGRAVASALLGTLSHVLIDLFNHDRNPLLWPWSDGAGFHLMPLPRDVMTVLVHGIAIALLYYAAATHWRR